MILVFVGEEVFVVRRMLTLADREELSLGPAKSLEYTEIAVLIGRDASVVSREVARHGGRVGYRAVGSRSRPKVMALDCDRRLRAQVVGLFRFGWSPASIAGWSGES